MSVKIEALSPLVQIATGSVAVPLKLTSLPATSIIIQAEYTNIGRISIGDSAVTTSTGIEIGPGDTFTLSIESVSKVGEFDLADVYVVSNTAGDSVRVLVLRRK